jgi:HSP20 family protein
MGVVETSESRRWIYETEDAFILEADLPGVKQQDVRIEIENNHLVLRGSRCVESGLLSFHIMERSSGYFVRDKTPSVRRQ